MRDTDDGENGPNLTYSEGNHEEKVNIINALFVSRAKHLAWIGTFDRGGQRPMTDDPNKLLGGMGRPHYLDPHDMHRIAAIAASASEVF